MKVFLLYRDRDFDSNCPLPPHSATLMKDLEIDRLLGAMAAGDASLFDVAKKTLFASLSQTEDILYRQQVLRECLEHAAVIRDIYAIAVEAIEQEKKVWGAVFGRYPDSSLSRSIDVLRIFIGSLERLRVIADQSDEEFHSEGLKRFFEMITRELNDAYLDTVKSYLQRLTFKRGVLLSAARGKGNKLSQFVLLKPQDEKRGWRELLKRWMEQLSSKGTQESFVYQVADRDEAGMRALTELKGRGISNVATALAQSTDHILSFFTTLRMELGFYVGCLNLRDRLINKKEAFCFPEPMSPDEQAFSARALYDVSLSLSIEDRAVGNDVDADEKSLVLITGANRGGKSTFLRSVGLSQLMMQCGMFVAAQRFSANIRDGLYTHFKREEDNTLKSGKLDEELHRMSVIVDSITPHSLMLLNESFGSTNEREGSEIARQIVRSLLDSGVKVFYVTHMFDLAGRFYQEKMVNSLFLRAERLDDSTRTFRLIEGAPLPTSYGEDLYWRIFCHGPLQDEESSLRGDDGQRTRKAGMRK
jgi:DNA mismatch repair ATPase MutS